MRRTWLVGTPIPDAFPLPHEVFELGLKQGALLVYIYLVYHKSLKRSETALSCAAIGKAVGLCEKTVQRHLRTLASKDFIRMECVGKSFSYTLCPIQNNVKKRRDVDLFSPMKEVCLHEARVDHRRGVQRRVPSAQ